MFSDSIVDTDRGDVLQQAEIPMVNVHWGEQRIFKQVEKAMEGARIGDEVEVILNIILQFEYLVFCILSTSPCFINPP